MKKHSLFLFSFALAASLSGCGQHSTQSSSSSTGASSVPSPAASPAVQPPTPPPSVAPAPNNAPSTTHSEVIYTPAAQSGQASDNELVPRTIYVSNPHDPAKEAVDALIHAAGSPIATGTRLLGIRIHSGVADVNFSQSPVDENGGEDTQSEAIAALLKTLGQFPNINQVNIEVNGKSPASIGEAAGGTMPVIRPNGPASDSNGA